MAVDTSLRDDLRNGAARDLKKEDIWCVGNGGLEVLSSYLVILTVLRDIFVWWRITRSSPVPRRRSVTRFLG